MVEVFINFTVNKNLSNFLFCFDMYNTCMLKKTIERPKVKHMIII